MSSSPIKTVILAGGLGTRLAEATDTIPKPMVEIGGRPILWHIMQQYAHHGFGEFLVALGYRAETVKQYFRDYCTLSGSMTVHLSSGRVQAHEPHHEDWIVHLIDTGLHTMTGGRLDRLGPWLRDDTFMLTYGDGVSDVDLAALLDFHRRCGRIATITAVRPPARFGGIVFDGDLVAEFTEKPQVGEGWINGGFMVFEPRVFDYLGDDDCILEKDVLERLAAENQLAAFRHDDFWQCMDTLRDVRLLEKMWRAGDPPWVRGRVVT